MALGKLLASCIFLSVIPSCMFWTWQPTPTSSYYRDGLRMIEKPRGPVMAGDSVTIRCKCYGCSWFSPVIAWYRNGRNLRLGRNVLTFTAKREDDQAQYECKMSDHADFRDQVTITVYYKPVYVIVSSRKTSSRAGEKDRFTCIAPGGNPAPTLRIYLKRSGGTPVEVSQGQDRVMAKADNQAEYYCEAKVPGYPALDMTSTRKIYRVTFPFTKVSFTNNPTAAVAVGQVKMFTCETDETNLARVTTAWDQQINGSSWRRIGTGSASPGRRSVYGGKIMVDHFHLIATKAMHQSTVRCMMIGVGPGVYLRSTTTKMFVKWYMTGLKMVEKPSGPVDAGVTVKIKCETDSSNAGFPGPILWYREGQRITTGVTASTRPASDGGTISVSELTFTVRKEDNQANYECKINDQASFRQDVNITVHFKPSKIKMLHKQLRVIHEGQLFIVACETDSANPPADIQLYRRRGTHREQLTAGIASHERAAEYNGKVRTTTVARIANRSDNQAVFECQVRDGSFHLEQATRVTVIYKPDSVIVSAGKTSTRAGDKDRFLCNATGGNPAPTLRIYLKRSGGTPVEVSQGQDRVMAKEDNQAEYYCEAKVPGYPALDVTSTRKIYRVTFPFTKVSFINPTAAVEVGQVKMFTCKTDEGNLDGVTNTTWDQYVYGSSWRLISTGHATPGRSGVYGGRIMVDHFNITATKAMHQSIVRCQFLGRDGHGQTLVSTITRMYVNWYVAELKMIKKPSGPVDAGVTVKIKCKTDSTNSGFLGPILWYRNGRQIRPVGVTASTRAASDGGTIWMSELTFTVRKEDNQANYECKINDQASFRQDVNITVHFKPSKILMIHKPLTAIKEGKAFIITCTTDSANPAAIIQFYRRRGTNREEITKGIRSNGRTAGYGKIRTSTLVVTAIRSDNQAVFECRVQDGSFHLQQATTVTVYH